MSRREGRLAAIRRGMRLRAQHVRDLLRAHPDDHGLLGALHGLEFSKLDRWENYGYVAYNSGLRARKGAR